MSTEPSIIISASGMCEVGRIKHHLKHNLWDPTSTILFVGYQAPGTLGRTIVEGAERVKVFGEEIAVNARVEYIEGFSGHADQTWLLNFVNSFTNPPKHIFLVHGEPEGQEELKNKIESECKISVTIPGFGESYELNGKLPILLDMFPEVKAYEKEFDRLDIIDKIESLKEDISDIESIVKEDALNSKDSDINLLNERIKEIQKQIMNLMK